MNYIVYVVFVDAPCIHGNTSRTASLFGHFWISLSLNPCTPLAYDEEPIAPQLKKAASDCHEQWIWYTLKSNVRNIRYLKASRLSNKQRVKTNHCHEFSCHQKCPRIYAQDCNWPTPMQQDMASSIYSKWDPNQHGFLYPNNCETGDQAFLIRLQGPKATSNCWTAFLSWSLLATNVSWRLSGAVARDQCLSKLFDVELFHDRCKIFQWYCSCFKIKVNLNYWMWDPHHHWPWQLPIQYGSVSCDRSSHWHLSQRHLWSS